MDMEISRLSDMTRDPILRAFFRRGEGHGPAPEFAAIAPPIKPAPAALEMEVA